jgi:hypothetical protein
MTPWCVRVSRRYRWRQLRTRQRIQQLDVEGGEHLRDAVRAGHGVLITPNHSTHYDSAALYVGADRVDVPLYFMTAWQVFAMSSRLEVMAMQRLGCFSIDRESTDRQAFKQAVSVLQTEAHPLVIFPEGDIYHTNDSITPFREGAAAIAISAAKRAERKVVVVPTAIKFFYVDDPTDQMLATMQRLEERVLLRPAPHRPLIERIYRLAEGVVALKELDFFSTTRSGSVKERAAALTDAILTQMETRHSLPSRGTVPERAKALRQALIKQVEDETMPSSNGALAQLQQEMEDVFFVMQLYSYPGDYLHPGCSVERLAETVDKFEEDILGKDLPSVRGRRRVVVRFGAPVPVGGEGRKVSSSELTQVLHGTVQQLIQEINAAHGNAATVRG